MPQDPAQLQRQRDLLRGQSAASSTTPVPQLQPPVDTRPTKPPGCSWRALCARSPFRQRTRRAT
eukprot:11218975-Alexandrium_andersonii.AAC.1